LAISGTSGETTAASPPRPSVQTASYSDNASLNTSDTSGETAAAENQDSFFAASLANYNGPIPRDVMKNAAANSTNCKMFVFKLMDSMFHKKELVVSSLHGGVGKYRGKEINKQTLSPSRMKSIFKAAKLRYPNEFPAVVNTPSFKEAINMKCRKTVFKPSSEL